MYISSVWGTSYRQLECLVNVPPLLGQRRRRMLNSVIRHSVDRDEQTVRSHYCR